MITKTKSVCGEEIIFDLCDLPIANKHTWYVTRTKQGVVAAALTHIDGRMVTMHRLFMNPPEGMLVDHKNGNPLDNRRENLRLATYSQNNRNRRAKRGTSTGLKGTSFWKGKYKAEIWLNGKNQYLGLFPTKEEAHAAYAKAAFSNYGEFARIQ